MPDLPFVSFGCGTEDLAMIDVYCGCVIAAAVPPSPEQEVGQKDKIMVDGQVIETWTSRKHVMMQSGRSTTEPHALGDEPER